MLFRKNNILAVTAGNRFSGSDNLVCTFICMILNMAFNRMQTDKLRLKTNFVI